MFNRLVPHTLVAFLLGCTFASPLAFAENSSAAAPRNAWTFSAHAAFNSKYIWRGIDLVDDPVFQPSLAAYYGGLTLSIWGNMELTNSNYEVGEFTELDYVADYTWAWDTIALSVGVIHYQFPNIGPPTTTELYGAIALSILLDPALTVYQDVDQADGTYISLSLGHTFENVWSSSGGITVSAGFSGSLGYGSSNFNLFYYGFDKETFTDATLSATLPITLSEEWSLTPSISYATLLEGGVRQGMDKDDNVWGGLTVSYCF
jgi:hypothetical protein